MLKRISIFLGVISIILIYPIHYASAAWYDFLGIGNITKNALTNVFTYFWNFVIGAIAKVLITIAVWFVEWGININHTIVSGDSLAHYGWGITLGIANLLIVIAIVTIAFGTILRKEWGLKSLPRLIIIALLINFSYFIATELITIADNITVAFLDAAKASLTWTSFAEFSATNIKNVDWSLATALGTAGSAVANLASPLFSIAFTFVAFLSLLAIAVAFFTRYVILTVLLMLLPIALAASLFSVKIGKGNAWQQWTDEFIKWLVFGPIMAFFIFLAFAVLKHPPATTPGFETSFGVGIGNYIVIIGILIAGLKISHSMGIAAAGTAYGLAQKGGKWALSKGKRWGTQLATAPLRKEGGKKLTAALQAAPKWTGAPAVGYALNKFGAMGEKLVDEGKFKAFSPDRLAQAVPSLSGPDRVAALSILAKKGDLTKVRNLGDYLNKDTETLFKSYGKNFGDIEKGAGTSHKAYQAFMAGDMDTFEKETIKFHLGLSDKDRAKLPYNNIYGDYDKDNPYLGFTNDSLLRFRDATTKAIVPNDPGNINKIYPKLKRKNFDNFLKPVLRSVGVQPKQIKTEVEDPNGMVSKIDTKEAAKNKADAIAKLEILAKQAGKSSPMYKVNEALKKTLASHETGIGFWGEEAEEKEEAVVEEKKEEPPKKS